MVLAVSLPSVVDEMTPEDEADFQRFEKLLDRLGKAMIMSAELETSEIIRRRLFEWGGLPDDAKKTAAEYADWVQAHRTQVPNWFPVDHAKDAFATTYPFHPTLLSVFERKWQALPRFQQTRGILRLLALWVANAYQAGFKGAHKDPLIGMGTAPLDDPLFRSAIFEQLGGAKLEGAVTTDICGKKDSHALRLDKEAVETIRKARLHQKVATTIFFESNGGQAKAEATLPEIRLAVAEPDLDVGNVETALEALSTTCYYLSAEKNRYRFSLSPNLNKLLADRRASVQSPRVEERIRAEVQKVFAEGKGVIDRIFFPDKSGQIPDVARLTLVVLPPDLAAADKATRSFVDAATKEHGSSARTFKSGLVWAVPEGADSLRDDARKALAWEDIADEESDLRLDDGQKRQLAESHKKAQRDIKETVWRTYKDVMILGKDGEGKIVDLGLVHSSAAPSISQLIIERLGQAGDIEDKGVSPNFLVRNWPPAFKEWNTRSVRDAFFASPQFPRLLNPELDQGYYRARRRERDAGLRRQAGRRQLCAVPLEQLAIVPGRRNLRRRFPHPARARGGIQGRQYSQHDWDLQRAWHRRRAWHLHHGWQLHHGWHSDRHFRRGWHTGEHSSPRVEWRYPAPKVDELLHEGALEVRCNCGLEAYP